MPPTNDPAHDLYRDMVDVTPDAMLAVDAATREIRLVNARAAELFGYERAELIGQQVDVLVHGLPLAAPSRTEVAARHRDGGELPVETWLSPLPASETLVGVALRDAADRRSVAEASERMRDELIATVSHELRTPLTSILGYTELLVEMGVDAVGEDAARLLGIVRRNAQRELKLVEDLLTLAGLGTASVLVRPEPTDLGAVTRSVVEELAPLAADAGVELVGAGEPEVWVVGDAQRLAQVLGNLVTNALKFTECGGRVEVRLSLEEGHGLVEVEDQGMGVHADELPKVFERLYRSPAVVAGQFPGAGIGLPIVKGIVDAHDGHVDVVSELGQGTTVQVKLPLAAAPLPLVEVPLPDVVLDDLDVALDGLENGLEDVAVG